MTAPSTLVPRASAFCQSALESGKESLISAANHLLAHCLRYLVLDLVAQVPSFELMVLYAHWPLHFAELLQVCLGHENVLAVVIGEGQHEV